jgi:hypothetical protein
MTLSSKSSFSVPSPIQVPLDSEIRFEQDHKYLLDKYSSGSQALTSLQDIEEKKHTSNIQWPHIIRLSEEGVPIFNAPIEGDMIYLNENNRWFTVTKEVSQKIHKMGEKTSLSKKTIDELHAYFRSFLPQNADSIGWIFWTLEDLMKCRGKIVKVLPLFHPFLEAPKDSLLHGVQRDFYDGVVVPCEDRENPFYVLDPRFKEPLPLPQWKRQIHIDDHVQTIFRSHFCPYAAQCGLYKDRLKLNIEMRALMLKILAAKKPNTDNN